VALVKKERLALEQERQLVAAAKSGSNAAMSTLWMQFERLVGSIARSVSVKTGLEFEDLYQEAYLSFADCVKTHDPTRGSRLCTFAPLVVRRKLMKIARRALRAPVPADVESWDLVDEAVDLERWKTDCDDQLQSGIAALPEREQLVIRRVLAGDSHQDIAADMRLSRQRVQQLYQEGIELLREYML